MGPETTCSDSAQTWLGQGVNPHTKTKTIEIMENGTTEPCPSNYIPPTHLILPHHPLFLSTPTTPSSPLSRYLPEQLYCPVVYGLREEARWWWC